MLDFPLNKTLLDLASYLERSTDYNQNSWDHCICAHARKMFGIAVQKHGSEHYLDIGKRLGLERYQTETLFKGREDKPSAKRAASVVRHLALTGEVDWDF